MGIMGDMDQMDAMIYGDLENDADLEAELAALTGEGQPKPSKKLGTYQCMGYIFEPKKNILGKRDCLDNFNLFMGFLLSIKLNLQYNTR